MKRKQQKDGVVTVPLPLTAREYQLIQESMRHNGATTPGEWVRRKTKALIGHLFVLEACPTAEVLLYHRMHAQEDPQYRFPLKNLLQHNESSGLLIDIPMLRSMENNLHSWEGYTREDILYSACLFAWRIERVTFDRFAILCDGTTVHAFSLVVERAS